jgi:hypothetical protein
MINTVVRGAIIVTLPLVLSACVATMPQPANSPRSSALLANPNVVNSPVVVAPKASPKPVMAQPLQSSSAGASQGGAKPDWTSLFKSWENGCESSREYKTFEQNFVFFGDQATVKVGKVILPPAMKAATGVPTSRDKGDHTVLTLPLTAGTYYGIPVRAIELYRGNENGIGGEMLLLNASVNDVKLALKKQKVSFKKRHDFQAVIGSDPKDSTRSWVVCDHSN